MDQVLDAPEEGTEQLTMLVPSLELTKASIPEQSTLPTRCR